ncbi:MAG TPA: LacI family DNA-binding transcriptional regulator [Sphingomicrobium sp.]|jgi:LacI family transcriptional regulator
MRSGEGRRVTIREVSAAAGVSIKTVSRVLNREPHVKDKTRKKVEAAVERLNFRPSSVARTLAGHRSFQVALLYDNPSPYYINEVQTGALERCAEEGFRLMFQPCDSSSPTLVDTVLDFIEETHVDGLILTPPVGDNFPLLDELQRRNVRFVRVAPGDDRPIAPAAAMDDVAAAREMTEFLLSLGHRRVGFIVGHPAHAASGQRLAGYRSAFAANGMRVDPSLIQPGHFDFESGKAATAKLLDLRNPPTAIFASNDDMAAGALAVAHERGISVPDELAIAGFDDTNLANAVWPPLTTVHQPMRALAREAADLLLAKSGSAERRILRHEIVVRGTTGVSIKQLDR